MGRRKRVKRDAHEEAVLRLTGKKEETGAKGCAEDSDTDGEGTSGGGEWLYNGHHWVGRRGIYVNSGL